MKNLPLPWSKSITNRDLILASISEWKTVLDWVLFSDDTRFMMNALRDLWIEIEVTGTKVTVQWWISRIKKQETEIYVGQSGIAIKFLPVMCCLLSEWKVTFVWEERLMERPLWPLIDAIKQLWVQIDSRDDNFPPLTIYGWWLSTESQAWDSPLIKMDGTISSQYFSALLNIGAFIKWWLEIEVSWDLVSKPYIDMSILELSKFGIEVENDEYKKFKVLEKNVGAPLVGTLGRNITIEWDASSLSYIANYIVLHWWRIKISNLWKNSKQWDYKYLEILQKYFGLIWESDWESTVLKAGWIDKNSPLLQRRGAGGEGEEINFENMPDVSMSFMSLAIFLPWKTKITGLKTLNLKECKRIEAMETELKKLWVEVSSTSSSIEIWEYKGMKWWGGLFGLWKIKIETYNDHRIAMTFGVLKTYLQKKYSEKMKILNPDCVNKTYPNFWEDLKKLWEVEDNIKI